MGLTIHYSLRANQLTLRQVRQKIGRIAKRARELEFSVSELMELPDDRDLADVVAPSVKIGRGMRRTVWPSAGVAFRIHPGPGCEVATIGLARFPASIRLGSARIPTRLTGWSWYDFCKTQYASNPRLGGTANFLRCHVGLISLLDLARQLGIRVKVSDEGGYWKKRDLQALVKELGEWNEFIAAFGGLLKDAHGDVEAPIFAFPNFEPLEARGQRHLRRR